MPLIKVAIVEDEEDINLGLSHLIRMSEGFECRAYLNAEDALLGIQKQPVDVVLMDINLPEMNGIECTRLLKQKYPKMQIMMCTVYEDDEKIFKAIAAGASGYILKRTEPAKLVESIRDLYNGGAPMSSQIARKVISSLQQLQKSDLENDPLSEREKEVLELLGKGFRNKDVADQLFISISTVKSHVHKIYEKLHVTSRIEAVNKVSKINKGFSTH
jgi:DNA-binding NarL/FixJ family response regulator